jgi:hypothetical protein
MRFASIIMVFLFMFTSSSAQKTISGHIKTSKGLPVGFANVFIKTVFDGAITNDSGYYFFTTKTSGSVIVSVTCIGYENKEMNVIIDQDSLILNVELLSSAKNLGEVTITAGAFEVSDKKRAVVLRPLDIVTTAGAAGDIFGALQTLPGVAPANNETGLFVRGGAAHESKTIVDGLIVANPFFGDAPDVPQRARFSPFGFTGMVFSTGGYSAEYGQALSSVLILNSNNEVKENTSSIGITAAGVNASITKKLKNKNSIFGEVNFSDLKPLFIVIPQNRDWVRPPNGYGFTGAYVQTKNEKQVLRVQVRYQRNSLALQFPDFENNNGKSLFSNNADNITGYVSYQNRFKKNWNFFGGISLQYDNQNGIIDTFFRSRKEYFMQTRFSVAKRLHRIINFKTGAELQFQNYATMFDKFLNRFKQTYNAVFAETDLRISSRLLLKTGLRSEYSFLNRDFYISPRSAMSYKAGIKSQFSFAYGHFYQSPENRTYATNNQLGFEKAVHYLVNYQWLTDVYSFRVELYHKEYKSLVRYKGITEFSELKNTGSGYAQGIDIFWRDNKATLKNIDYWISYGFILSERLYKNINFDITPYFAPKHTFNVVGKYELPKIRSRIGVTYTYSTARSVYNPVTFEVFNTRDFQNMSCTISHITTLFKSFSVIYFSVNNILNRKNVVNYRFSINGQKVEEVNPPVFRSAFAGISIRF